MHSFHHSRGRILFEVFCAFAIAASFAGTWMQTGVWAMLLAALVALLYGLIHAFDMAGYKAAVAVEPQRIDFATDHQGNFSVRQNEGAPAAVVGQQPESDRAIEDVELVELSPPRATKARRAKSPRQGSARGAKAPIEAKAAEPALPEEFEAPAAAPTEEAAHHSFAPLFEPEPFARQRHAVFGRKAG